MRITEEELAALKAHGIPHHVQHDNMRDCIVLPEAHPKNGQALQIISQMRGKTHPPGPPPSEGLERLDNARAKIKAALALNEHLQLEAPQTRQRYTKHQEIADALNGALELLNLN